MTDIAASGERGNMRHVVARLERLPYCSWHLKNASHHLHGVVLRCF
jgi:hypothetical protein